MSQLTEVLEQVEQRVDAFYQQAIDLHNNEKLRSLVGTPIPIFATRYKEKLMYGQKGFYATIPKCIEAGDYLSGGTYDYPDYAFKEKNGKLVVKSHEGRQEMLHLFPELTLTTLEERVIAGIQKTGLFRGDTQ